MKPTIHIVFTRRWLRQSWRVRYYLRGGGDTLVEINRRDAAVVQSILMAEIMSEGMEGKEKDENHVEWCTYKAELDRRDRK